MPSPSTTTPNPESASNGNRLLRCFYQKAHLARRITGVRLLALLHFELETAPSKSAANACKFLKALHEACPIKIKHILTDNGKEFTDRLFASRARVPTGEHAFDKLCAELGIEHRLTKPRTPQTNGMVERFNGRISDVLQSHHFVSGEDLAQTLYRYVLLYNQQLPQSTLGSKTPLDAMQRWHESHPHLFVKRPYNLAGGDTCFFMRVSWGNAPSGPACGRDAQKLQHHAVCATPCARRMGVGLQYAGDVAGDVALEDTDAALPVQGAQFWRGIIRAPVHFLRCLRLLHQRLCCAENKKPFEVVLCLAPKRPPARPAPRTQPPCIRTQHQSSSAQ